MVDAIVVEEDWPLIILVMFITIGEGLELWWKRWVFFAINISWVSELHDVPACHVDECSESDSIAPSVLTTGNLALISDISIKFIIKRGSFVETPLFYQFA